MTEGLAHDGAANQRWAEALNALRLMVARPTFDHWLRDTRVIAQDGDEWVIEVASEQARTCLENRLAGTVHRALELVGGGPDAVRFVERPPPELPGAAVRPPEEADPVWPVDEADPVGSVDHVRSGDLAWSVGEAPSVGEGSPVEAGSVVDEGSSVGEEPPAEGESAGGGRQARVGSAPASDLQWTDFYIKVKVGFRKRALRDLKGVKLAVFLCLALHVDRDGWAMPGGIEAIMGETGYSRGAVCDALADLETLGLIRKRRSSRGTGQYAVLGYAWFGPRPAPCLWEEAAKQSKKWTRSGK